MKSKKEYIENMQNPFSITFGIEPLNFINRQKEVDIVLDSFSGDYPSNSTYLLLGARGSGKTVLMSYICSHYEKDDNWIVIDVGAKYQLLEKICSLLYEKGKIKHFFLNTEVNFSFHGITFSLKGKNPVTTPLALLTKMLDILRKKHKKVLIAIDEVDNSDELKYFISDYQQLLRSKYSVYLLMTGLYENVSKLQNDAAIPFLYRSPKIILSPLSLRDIAYSYQNILGVTLDEGIKLAKFTKGYAYAYQVLGNILYSKEKKDLNDEVISEFDKVMAENAYEKIYSELSETEQKIVLSIDTSGEVTTKSLREKLSMNIKTFSVYRDILIKKGVLTAPHYGIVSFALPRFKEFLDFMKI